MKLKRCITVCKGPGIFFKVLTFAIAALWNVIIEQEFALVIRKHEKKNQKSELWLDWAVIKIDSVNSFRHSFCYSAGFPGQIFTLKGHYFS